MMVRDPYGREWNIKIEMGVTGIEQVRISVKCSCGLLSKGTYGFLKKLKCAVCQYEIEIPEEVLSMARILDYECRFDAAKIRGDEGGDGSIYPL